ncbi:R3H domain-containing nucleic acid-binding protein [Thermostichus vulcanus]|uniref:AAA family ATPase n=1 Tax=Thermostichus vulcanus str. 'Rupite' TaxID=2813851 RepID=A0ABT0CF80_THEVL|nr:R3H domain-containing nucleic acid-binding protein [Thermostichus vulcanus]MCJ2544443.1 AAA family ATPase [Thermostichus vulcanus str. 'Rupite']
MNFPVESSTLNPLVDPDRTDFPGQAHYTDDLSKLLDILPTPIRERLEQHPQLDRLVEVVLDLGRRPEARFPGSADYLSEEVITRAELDQVISRVGEFSGDNRAGIASTLHRISAIRNRQGTIIGLTCRVGRCIIGVISMIRDLVEQGRSMLLLGRPGVGKTTALREIARVLADDLHKRVVIIDTSNEIAGDGDVPHPGIGRARRMQVATPELQHKVMIEAVENHMPEVVVIDEIGTELEALASRTIAERGVQLVATAHGNRIDNLIKNPTLSDLVGGIQSVTLGDDEARRRGSQKSVLERKAPPTFDIAVEMLERARWVVHEDVAATVDRLLRNREPLIQTRSLDEQGQVVIERPVLSGPQWPPASSPMPTARERGGWRRSGRMEALPLESLEGRLRQRDPRETNLVVEAGSRSSLGLEEEESLDLEGSQGEDKPRDGDGPLMIYPYGVSRFHLEQVIQTLKLQAEVTKDLDGADIVLALRSHVRNRSKIQQLAQSRQIPVHTVKANTLIALARALRHILNIESEDGSDSELELFIQASAGDETEALEEARLAVEQIVIPKSQPVELLPRSALIRKLQHQLVEHYHLRAQSFGEEPNRRLRIYPN